MKAECDRLEEEYAEVDELPEEVDQRLGEIETALAAFDERPVVYDLAKIARAGVFVSIDGDGDLRIERGYVRPEDEAPVEMVQGNDGDAAAASEPSDPIQRGVITIGGNRAPVPATEAEEDDGLKPLSERLITELTAHRRLALRDALANDPGVAFAAVLHAGCLSAFYRMSSGTCLEISAKSASFSAQAPGLADSTSAKAIEARHRQWAEQLPKRGFWSEVQRVYENCIWTSLPSSLRIAWNGVLKPRHFLGVRLAVRMMSWISSSDTLSMSI